MMVKVHTGAVRGVDAFPVVAEVDVSTGMPGYHLVGRAAASVSEGRVRIKAALANAGFDLKSRRIIVNLAPAEIRKDSSAFDLPVAVGILGAYEQIPVAALDDAMLVGELALDGSLRPVRGVLPMAVLARQQGISTLFVPEPCAGEASLVDGLDVIAAGHLGAVVGHLRGDHALPPHQKPAFRPPLGGGGVDLAEVRGQSVAKRALTIAAAGGHNLLMVGPPGAGKSMLARRLPTLLPPIGFAEALETTKIYSVAGLLPGTSLLERRPFRAPHHTISAVGLVGGGPALRPGELSLAHHGVLFLDELLEFRRVALESLRQPLEDGEITITRARGTVTFPASVQLVAAMNPCPCGYWGDTRRTCTCSRVASANYWRRLSGPLADRIDLQVGVQAVSYAEMTAADGGERSAAVAEQAAFARRRMSHRYGEGRTNARMSSREVRHHCRLDPRGEQLVERAMEKQALSARAVERVLKVARTIADLEGAPALAAAHIAEALSYRRRSFE